MLQVRQVNTAYGDVQALWNLSLEVSQGEIVTLIGANGAGKSTLLKTISGLLKPTAGEILFEGQSIGGRSPNEIVELGIAQVPEGRKLWPGMTVEENLLMGAFGARARSQLRENLARVLEMFPKLKQRLRQYAGTLSGGEQQMVAIGRGIMSAPRLIMLDEPSLGLAPSLVAEVFETVEALARQGVTILLVEQNIHHALEVAHRGYVLDNGRITMQNESKALLEDPLVRSTYLGI